MRHHVFVILAAVLCCLSGSVSAADVYGSRPPYELRVGLFAHDPWSPERGSASLNIEALAPLPGLERTSLFWPRLQLGATLDTAGKTSIGYAGLSWKLPLSERLFAEASFGGALNSGETGRMKTARRNAMGCALGFRESASLGYQLSESLSLMATIEHSSNAGLCENNRGLTNVGVRLGYSF